VMGSVLGGGALQVKNASTTWGGAEAGLLGGTVAAVALAPFAIVALSRARGWGARRNSPESKDSG
jgi:hypothetical protein